MDVDQEFCHLCQQAAILPLRVFRSGIILNQKHQSQTKWCDNCRHDHACRIPGWPVLNATSACDVSPKDWLFSANGPCCASGNEPNDLATWITSMCNGTWREQFSYYDGMAKIDWEDYEVPYNYTVSPKNTNSQLNPEPTCPRPSHYFGIFVAENIASLLGCCSPTQFAPFFGFEEVKKKTRSSYLSLASSPLC